MLAEDWPLFRGSALQTGVAASPLPEELEIRWKFKAKDGIEGAAAIVNANVFSATPANDSVPGSNPPWPASMTTTGRRIGAPATDETAMARNRRRKSR